MNRLEQRVFPFVDKPARYTDHELNAIHKDWAATEVKVAFSFPDLYEVGSANLGLQIFYTLINALDFALLERVFMPAQDCEDLLRAQQIPLFSLESKTPIRDFDMLAFTLQTELTYTNILNVLELSGLPLHAQDRDAGFPLVFAGGSGAYNPEPLAAFIDFFVIGEGEEVFPEILARVRDLKQSSLSKSDLLKALSEIDGVYVPALFNVTYKSDQTIDQITSCGPTPFVQRRIIRDLDAIPSVERPIVPYIEVVHDRAVLEIMRGCKHGCRFCQAGFVSRPVRERSADQLVLSAKNLISNTGHEELSLISLSSSDYSCIDKVATDLTAEMEKKRVSLSLPSLRADSITQSLSTQITSIRKAGFTIAPEAGSQRLRDVINKNLTEENILTAAHNIFSAGAEALKLYFMIGLPTEQDEDVLAIKDLAFKIINVSREISGHRLKRIVVNTSFFIPKPHTPFQFSAMISLDEIHRKVKLLKSTLRHAKIDFKYHDIYTSLLEGILSRGDRKMSAVIEAAFRAGCKMDAWRENFNYDKWTKAFDTVGVDPVFYSARLRDVNEVMPWDHLQTGVDKSYLISQYQAAINASTTAPCLPGCKKCGLC